MKHPVWDRILLFICALAALAGAAGIVMLLMGYISMDFILEQAARLNPGYLKHQIILIAAAVVLALLAIFLLSAMIPSRKKRKKSSTFAIQRNENGLVRISVKALETLVQKVLDEHAEVKVVTSSMYSDEESIRVDIHIALQSDISMPLAISALQKQIKRYIEACSGVMVQEVRVFVDSTIPATEETKNSPYAIPASLLGKMEDSLPEAAKEEPSPFSIPAEPVPEPEAPVQGETKEEEPSTAETEWTSTAEVKSEEAPEEEKKEQPEFEPLFKDADGE